MTRLTDEQITQMVQSVMGNNEWPAHRAIARAAIIATLTEYAPHLLPRDPDEELAEEMAAGWNKSDGDLDHLGAYANLALYIIKRMKGEAK